MKARALSLLADSIGLMADAQKNADLVVEAANMIADAFTSGHKLLLFGNGGSAAQAQHIAAEFVNRLLVERPPLPAIALTTDTSILTSVGNDYAIDDIFFKQIQALGKQDDVALALTTSGTSPNIIKGLKAARSRGLKTIALTGADPSGVKDLSDLILNINSTVPPRIQEVHLIWGHIICDLVDYVLFQKPSEDSES